MQIDTHRVQLSHLPSVTIKERAGIKSFSSHLLTKSISILEEKIGEKLYDTGLGNDFLEMIPKEQETKAETDKWGYIKLKHFFKVRQYMEWEKIFANYICDKGLIFKICNKLQQLKSKRNKYANLKRGKGLE